MRYTEDMLLTTKQAADYLKLKPNTLAKYRSIYGDGPEYVKYPRSGRIFYRKSILDKYIEDSSGYTSTCEYET